MLNKLFYLFDTESFPPRWTCGTGWRQEPFWGWLHIGSDVAVWAAYMAIPLVLVYFLRKRPDLPFPKILWLFVAFIFACGTGHLIDAGLFWWPAYRFSGTVKFATAVVSWMTVYSLLPLLPLAFSFRTPAQLEELVRQRTEELQALTQQLQQEVERRTEMTRRLSENEARLRLALSAGGMGTWSWDFASGAVFMDATELDLTGLKSTNGQVHVEEFLQRVDPDDLPALQTAIQRAREDGHDYNHEFRYRRSDNSLHWLAGRGEVEFDPSGQPVRMNGVNFDITSQRTAHANLAESEDRFRTLADNIAQFAWMTDETGAIFWFNKRWFDYTGTTLAEMKGWGWRSVLHPEHVERVMQKFTQCVLAGDEWKDTFPLRGKDGTYRWFLSQARPIRDTAAKAPRWFGTNTDITEQLAVDRSLTQAHAQLKSIVDAAADVIVTLDDQGRILSVNSAVEQVFGYKPKEVIANPINLLIDWSDDPAASGDSQIRGIVVGRGREVQGLKRDGTTVPLEVSVSVTKLGKRKLYAAIIRDISERKRTEEVLRIRLRAIEFATNGILITDASLPDNPIIYVNPAFEALTGYSSEEVLGKNCRLLQGPDTNAVSVGAIRGAVKKRQECHVTLLNYRKDGSRFWNDLHISPVQDDHKNITHFIGVQSDITERIRYEQRLQEAQEQADSANRAKSEFLANMSHEIRTPLTAILGCADSLFRQIEDPDPKDVVRMIRDQGQLLLGILNDVLDLSKIEAGRLEIRIEPCDPVRIVGDVDSLMHSAAVEKGIELRTIYQSRMPDRIQTDPLRLRQILLNVVSNAVKFTMTGWVEIRISCLPVDDRMVLQIAVEDTGIGIPTDRIDTIFEAFAQAKNAVNARLHGTGLGLTICQKLVQMLRGTIHVTSKEGSGSQFVIEVPAGEIDLDLMKDPEELTLSAAKRDSHLSMDVFIPCRVLIAEDTRAIQFMMSRMLKDVVTSVTVAENGEMAVAAVEAAAQTDKPFDVILMDMQMPVLNGFDATRILRDRGYTLPVIALTAGAMSGDREKCLAVGCTDYLPKPIDRAELLAKLQQYSD